MKTDPNTAAFDPDIGLTKREYIATHIMVAHLTRGYYTEAFPDLAERSVAAADALISRLNATT